MVIDKNVKKIKKIIVEINKSDICSVNFTKFKVYNMRLTVKEKTDALIGHGK